LQEIVGSLPLFFVLLCPLAFPRFFFFFRGHRLVFAVTFCPPHFLFFGNSRASAASCLRTVSFTLCSSGRFFPSPPQFLIFFRPPKLVPLFSPSPFPAAVKKNFHAGFELNRPHLWRGFSLACSYLCTSPPHCTMVFVFVL